MTYIFSFSPRMETSDENQNAIIGDNMEKISKFNRDAKINPDNSDIQINSDNSDTIQINSDQIE